MPKVSASGTNKRPWSAQPAGQSSHVLAGHSDAAKRAPGEPSTGGARRVSRRKGGAELCLSTTSFERYTMRGEALCRLTEEGSKLYGSIRHMPMAMTFGSV